MNSTEFSAPLTRDSLATARRSLDATHLDIHALSNKIVAAEASLAKIVSESTLAIEDMLKEKRALEHRARHTLAYLSPMRRLPVELLREIFLWCFQSHPCSAWVLSSVCSSWMRLALRIPVIWSKVIFFSSQLRRIGVCLILGMALYNVSDRTCLLVNHPSTSAVCTWRRYL